MSYVNTTQRRLEDVTWTPEKLSTGGKDFWALPKEDKLPGKTTEQLILQTCAIFCSC